MMEYGSYSLEMIRLFQSFSVKPGTNDTEITCQIPLKKVLREYYLKDPILLSVFLVVLFDDPILSVPWELQKGEALNKIMLVGVK